MMHRCLVDNFTLEESRAETVGAAVSAVREAVKALSWELAAAMRPCMSMFALGVSTRGLAVAPASCAPASPGVVGLDSSSAYMLSFTGADKGGHPSFGPWNPVIQQTSSTIRACSHAFLQFYAARWKESYCCSWPSLRRSERSTPSSTAKVRNLSDRERRSISSVL